MFGEMESPKDPLLRSPNLGASIITYIILGAPYYNYSILGPKTLFKLLRPLHYLMKGHMKPLGSFVAANLSGNPEGVGIGFKVHLPRRTLPDPTEAAENLQNRSTTRSLGRRGFTRFQ